MDTRIVERKINRMFDTLKNEIDTLLIEEVESSTDLFDVITSILSAHSELQCRIIAEANINAEQNTGRPMFDTEPMFESLGAYSYERTAELEKAVRQSIKTGKAVNGLSVEKHVLDDEDLPSPVDVIESALKRAKRLHD